MVPMSLGMFVRKLVTCKEKKSKLLVICKTAIIQVKFNDFSQKCDLHSFEKNEKKNKINCKSLHRKDQHSGKQTVTLVFFVLGKNRKTLLQSVVSVPVGTRKHDGVDLLSLWFFVHQCKWKTLAAFGFQRNDFFFVKKKNIPTCGVLIQGQMCRETERSLKGKIEGVFEFLQ